HAEQWESDQESRGEQCGAADTAEHCHGCDHDADRQHEPVHGPVHLDRQWKGHDARRREYGSSLTEPPVDLSWWARPAAWRRPGPPRSGAWHSVHGERPRNPSLTVPSPAPAQTSPIVEEPLVPQQPRRQTFEPAAEAN